MTSTNTPKIVNPMITPVLGGVIVEFEAAREGGRGGRVEVARVGGGEGEGERGGGEGVEGTKVVVLSIVAAVEITVHITLDYSENLA